MIFHDNTPYSSQFDDIYCNTQGAKGESEHVFLSALPLALRAKFDTEILRKFNNKATKKLQNLQSEFNQISTEKTPLKNSNFKTQQKPNFTKFYALNPLNFKNHKTKIDFNQNLISKFLAKTAIKSIKFYKQISKLQSANKNKFKSQIFTTNFKNFSHQNTNPSALKPTKFYAPQKATNPHFLAPTLIIAECGFGIGRNFLGALKFARKMGCVMHYVAAEKYPLNANDLREIYKKLQIYPHLSARFIAKFEKISPLNEGFHRIKFGKNITLDLLIGDASKMFKNSDFSADVWFMDGFSPAKNPDMWSDELIAQIARLSHFGTILRSYCVAKNFRETLLKHGFRLNLRPGFSKKRQMCEAFMQNPPKFLDEIWFSRPKLKRNFIKFRPILDTKSYEIPSIFLPRARSFFYGLRANFTKFKEQKKVTIIGAGIAGIATAIKFQKAGFDVKIIEKRAKIATNGSSNRAGALLPLITQKDVALGKMHLQAFLKACKFYAKLPQNLAQICGADIIAYDQTLKKRYKKADDMFKFVDFGALCGVKIPQAMSLKPRKICKFLAKKVEIKTNCEFVNFKKIDEKICIFCKNHKPFFSDILIFCTGSESENFFGNAKNDLNFGKKLNHSKQNSHQICNIQAKTEIFFPSGTFSAVLDAKLSDKTQILGVKLKNRAQISNPNSSPNLEQSKDKIQNFSPTYQNFDPFVQISSVRGQATLLRPFAKISRIISSVGYIMPPTRKFQLIGATYGRGDYDNKSRKKDDLKNIENILQIAQNLDKKEFLAPNLRANSKKLSKFLAKNIISSNVAFRSYSGDRFPIIGALHDFNAFLNDYKNLQFTKHHTCATNPKFIDNVYFNVAHGSRGLSSAILGAEILLDYALNRPFCVEKSIINALAPSRFLIRKLKNGQAQNQKSS